METNDYLRAALTEAHARAAAAGDEDAVSDLTGIINGLDTPDTPGTTDVQAAPALTDDEVDYPVDPEAFTREQLNALATRHAVDSPESYGTKAEVADAINAAHDGNTDEEDD